LHYSKGAYFERWGTRPAGSLQPKQGVELLHDAVAPASGAFEFFAIPDFDGSAAVFDDAFSLQNLG
jgi:hypothetical protein